MRCLRVGRVEKPKEEVHIVPNGVFTKDKLRFQSIGWTNALVRDSPLSEEREAEFLDFFLRELRVEVAEQDRQVTSWRTVYRSGRGWVTGRKLSCQP